MHTDLDDLPISLNLINRSERVDSAEVGPCHGYHTRRAIEFHSTASQWNHRVDETKILRLQVIDITEHLGFRVMRIEHWVREELGIPLKGGRQGQSLYRLQIRQGDGVMVGRSSSSEDVDQSNNIPRPNGLVQCDADVRVIYLTKVHPFCCGCSVDTMSVSRDVADVESQGVEEFFVERLEPVFLDSGIEDLRVGVYTAGDTSKTLWTVVNGVHCSHICE